VKQINNELYNDLGDAWWHAEDHMITFLRHESAIKVDFILKHCPAKKSLNILDLGSGAGLITLPLAQAGHRLTAVDLSEPALKQLQAKAHSLGIENNIQTIQANACKEVEKLSPTEKFDLVLAMDVLEHVENPQALIQTAQKYLRPGGVFIYHTLNKNWLCWLVYLQIAPRLIKHCPPHLHLYHYMIKPKQMTQWLSELGFQSSVPVGIHPPILQRGMGELLFTRAIKTPLHFKYCKSTTFGYLASAILN